MTVNDDTRGAFHPDNLRLHPGEVLAVTPKKIRKRRQHFTMFPMTWYERMKGANGQTYRVALYLCYLHWKNKGETVKLANGMLKIDGVSRQSKWRALADLERRGLITVDRRPSRSPIVRLHSVG